MKTVKRAACALFALALCWVITGCASNDAGNAGQTKLTFQIWDNTQKPAMEAMAAAYTQKNPNVQIDVQVTSWSEYWTKLEAAATGGSLPDIFWMHTDEILKYADGGILADLTDLYVDEETGFYEKHFPEGLLQNTRGSDGKVYGVPKDKDTICLVYSRDLFDAAGVSYPDESWTWDDLVSASQAIHDATGKYGYLANNDEHLGYWSYVYQAGGYILAPDKKTAGYTQPATQKAIAFYVGLQDTDWCPDQTYFAETEPATSFFSGEAAMYFEGSWGLRSKMEDYPSMHGKWDVAVLPACPDPMSGDGRATISNGLTYATGAKGKNLAAAKDFLKFLGTEEAQRIQGEKGAAIPAYNGLESTWLSVFDQFDYKLNAAACLSMFDYSVQSPNNAARPAWKTRVSDEMLRVYAGETTLDAALESMQRTVDELSNR